MAFHSRVSLSCPYCGSARVFRSSSFFLHTIRTMSNSSKRYCAACKKRWQSRYSGDLQSRLYGLFMLLLLFAVALFVMKLMDRYGAFAGLHTKRQASQNENIDSDPNKSILKNRIEAGRLLRRAQFLEKQKKRNIQVP